jgi:DNA-binding CsgD family transcriptional regulator
MSMETLRAELLADIEAHAAELLRDLGVPAALAEQAGCALADHLAENWGGQVFTMPKDHAYKLSRREREILELRAKGVPVEELARRFGMGVRGMRKLLARGARRHGVDNQLGLFEAEKDAAA